MQHNGVEFEVVQTANPTGWKWTFQIPGKRIKTGTTSSRTAAIVLAHAAIEKGIKVRRQPEPTQ
jgi:hypothetical protein